MILGIIDAKEGTNWGYKGRGDNGNKGLGPTHRA